MSRVEVRVARPDELAACQAVRHEVFVVEQGVPAELEVDGEDGRCVHVVALAGGVCVGTARLREVDGHAKAERVAVRSASRGAGLGARLMRCVEDAARARGHTELHLHAQEPVVSFYLDLGYVQTGPPFVEAGIPHRPMSRSLHAD